MLIVIWGISIKYVGKLKTLVFFGICLRTNTEF